MHNYNHNCIQPLTDKLPSLGFRKEMTSSILFWEGYFPFSPGTQPNPAQLSPWLTGSQRETALEECPYLADGACSELCGPGIGASPRESLGAGRRTCDPSDPSIFRSRVPSGVPKSVIGKRQNHSLSKTAVWGFRKRAFFVAALDARGMAPPRCACQKDTTTGYLCYL